ncbi:PREDICTED: UBP1-associated proteins 1C [Nelumbo nucifera]|uniref:U1-type domain-containing protein n=2 Tax=Nelumbo nucifera TaxID=4432 RepID=A0A822ZJT5_NELNU|nr:PREDICTED: UBP1-associated proteins 1C [Nelumbo nucifera]DAD44348.1 TPA_asm: hypothetical protein HUJ06_002578 [Nelumbo nucifera]DAD46374.1 TPA_asm: hypothetical protein HUJ06_004604 [Nelumbo nucifera]
MVWFQCEDCGENLKKPKLQNHFRICSATKLSCIDCGETFGQQSVQGHTQCITEAEKYGPKGQAKTSNGTPAKPNNESKQKPDIDINVGLSSRPPWFCSLCNTNATSRQTLLLHAEGKKHRAKARAFHAAKQQPKGTEESTPNVKDSTVNRPNEEILGNKDVEESKGQDPPKGTILLENTEADNVPSKKKIKLDASLNGSTRRNEINENSVETSNGEVIQAERAEAEKADGQIKKRKHVNVPKEEDKTECTEESNKKIKWKKLVTSILKSSPDGVLKMKKLQKLVLKSLQESGITEDEEQVKNMVTQKINSSSRFTLDNKLVRLVDRSRG